MNSVDHYELHGASSRQELQEIVAKYEYKVDNGYEEVLLNQMLNAFAEKLVEFYFYRFYNIELLNTASDYTGFVNFVRLVHNDDGSASVIIKDDGLFKYPIEIVLSSTDDKCWYSIPDARNIKEFMKSVEDVKYKTISNVLYTILQQIKIVNTNSNYKKLIDSITRL